MNRAKILLIACIFGLFSSPAFAQCSGQTPSGDLCGNDGSTTALPGWKTQTSILDRNFGAPSAQGTVLNRGASAWSATSSPVIGLPGTTTGSLGFAGSGSGTVTVEPQNAAGTWTFKLPTDGGTNGFVLTTDGSGNSTWANPAAGGTVTSVGLALPSSILTVSGSPVTISGTLTGSLATQTANTVWAGPTTGSAATPTFRSLVGADLPNPSASTLGGVRSYAAVTHQWINTISTSGFPSSTQPAFSDISGSIDPTQCPNPSATTIGCVQSLAPATSKWINQISTSGVPIATQPSFTDIAGSATLAQLPTISNNSVLGNNSGGTAVPSALTGTQVLDFIGTTQGNVLYRNGSVWTVLAPGTNGQVLTTGGAAANPSWATVTGTGTITSIATNNGVTGGTITTTGTIGLASIASGTVLANVTGGSTFPSSNTPTAVLDLIGSTEGQILYRGASSWLALNPGTIGQVLQTQGAGATPQWANAGTVSSVATGQGLSGGTITTSGTLVTAPGVPTNTRLAKTANYTALTADCGSSVALGGNAKFTLTVSAASGYSATCNFTVVNEDTQGSGRGKFIAINGLSTFILWPGQTIQIYNQNNVWQTTGPYRWRLTNNLNIYIDNTGSDTANDGLATGATGAFASIAQAANFRAFLVDQNGFTITANIAASQTITSSGGALHCSTVAVGGDGTSQFLIKGAGASSIVTDTSTNVFSAFYGCIVQLESMTIVAPAGNAITADRKGHITIGTGVVFGNASQDMFAAQAGGSILVSVSPTISGNCGNAYIDANNGGLVAHNGGTVTVTQNVTCPYVITGNNVSNITVNGSSFNMGAFSWTGTKWFLSGVSNIAGTPSGCAGSFFPTGATGGSTNTGSQCN